MTWHVIWFHTNTMLSNLSTLSNRTTAHQLQWNLAWKICSWQILNSLDDLKKYLYSADIVLDHSAKFFSSWPVFSRYWSWITLKVFSVPTYSLGQLNVLHCLSSRSCPMQSLPCRVGVGLSQFLVRELSPLAHEWLHIDHVVHSDQPPSAKNYVFLLLKPPSLLHI